MDSSLAKNAEAFPFPLVWYFYKFPFLFDFSVGKRNGTSLQPVSDVTEGEARWGRDGGS